MPHHGGRHLGLYHGGRRPGGGRRRKGWGQARRRSAPPPRLPQLVRPGTAWLSHSGLGSKPSCGRCGPCCVLGWEALAPPAAAAPSEVSAGSRREGGRDGTEGTFTPQRASRWRSNSATATYWPGADERGFARVCHDDPWVSWTPTCLGTKGQPGQGLDLGAAASPGAGGDVAHPPGGRGPAEFGGAESQLCS